MKCWPAGGVKVLGGGFCRSAGGAVNYDSAWLSLGEVCVDGLQQHGQFGCRGCRYHAELEVRAGGAAVSYGEGNVQYFVEVFCYL